MLGRCVQVLELLGLPDSSAASGAQRALLTLNYRSYEVSARKKRASRAVSEIQLDWFGPAKERQLGREHRRKYTAGYAFRQTPLKS